MTPTSSSGLNPLATEFVPAVAAAPTVAVPTPAADASAWREQPFEEPHYMGAIVHGGRIYGMNNDGSRRGPGTPLDVRARV